MFSVPILKLLESGMTPNFPFCPYEGGHVVCQYRTGTEEKHGFILYLWALDVTDIYFL
jgi:hypothetical protein